MFAYVVALQIRQAETPAAAVLPSLETHPAVHRGILVRNHLLPRQPQDPVGPFPRLVQPASKCRVRLAWLEAHFRGPPHSSLRAPMGPKVEDHQPTQIQRYPRE